MAAVTARPSPAQRMLAGPCRGPTHTECSSSHTPRQYATTHGPGHRYDTTLLTVTETYL